MCSNRETHLTSKQEAAKNFPTPATMFPLVALPKPAPKPRRAPSPQQQEQQLIERLTRRAHNGGSGGAASFHGRGARAFASTIRKSIRRQGRRRKASEDSQGSNGSASNPPPSALPRSRPTSVIMMHPASPTSPTTATQGHHLLGHQLHQLQEEEQEPSSCRRSSLAPPPTPTYAQPPSALPPSLSERRALLTPTGSSGSLVVPNSGSPSFLSVVPNSNSMQTFEERVAI